MTHTSGFCVPFDSDSPPPTHRFASVHLTTIVLDLSIVIACLWIETRRESVSTVATSYTVGTNFSDMKHCRCRGVGSIHIP